MDGVDQAPRMADQSIVMCVTCGGPLKTLGGVQHVEAYCEKCDVSEDENGTHQGNKEHKA